MFSTDELAAVERMALHLLDTDTDALNEDAELVLKAIERGSREARNHR